MLAERIQSILTLQAEIASIIPSTIDDQKFDLRIHNVRPGFNMYVVISFVYLDIKYTLEVYKDGQLFKLIFTKENSNPQSRGDILIRGTFDEKELKTKLKECKEYLGIDENLGC